MPAPHQPPSRLHTTAGTNKARLKNLGRVGCGSGRSSFSNSQQRTHACMPTPAHLQTLSAAEMSRAHQHTSERCAGADMRRRAVPRRSRTVLSEAVDAVLCRVQRHTPPSQHLLRCRRPGLGRPRRILRVVCRRERRMQHRHALRRRYSGRVVLPCTAA